MQDLSLDMFSAPMILTFMRQAFKIKAPHSFAILREIFPLKNEVITASVPKIIVSAAITAQEYKLRKKFTAILIVSLALKLYFPMSPCGSRTSRILLYLNPLFNDRQIKYRRL